MDANPTDHELNEVLARVAGVELIEQATGPTNLSWYYWVVDDEDEWPEGEWVKWNPLHDANQIELVKCALRNKEIFYSMQYVPMRGKHCYRLISADNMVITEKEDSSELRAFALTVYEMEQERKNNETTTGRTGHKYS